MARTSGSIKGRRRSEGPVDPDPEAVRVGDARQAILNAARDLFSAQGYSATSISEIVARAGTSVGLPYYHFGSKKEIFLALWKEYQANQEERAREAVAAATASGARGRELLLAGTEAYMWGAWEARDMVPMLHSMDAPSGFGAAILEADRRWERRNQALLGGYSPELVPAMTMLFAGALRAACLRLPRCRGRADAGQLIRHSLLGLAGLLDVLQPVDCPEGSVVPAIRPSR